VTGTETTTPAVGSAARRARASTTGAFAAQGFAYALVLTSLPVLAERHAIGTGATTLLVLAVCVMAAVGTVLAARIADGPGGSRVGLVLGVAALGVALTVVAIAPGLVALATGLAVYGLGLGLVDASANMQALSVQRVYGRSVLASFHGAWSAAGILGALVVSVTGGRWPERPVVAVLVLGVPVAVAVSLGVVRWGWRTQREEVADALVAPGDHARSVAAGDPEAAAGAGVPRPLVPWRPVLLLGGVLVAYYVVDSAVSTWSAFYLAGPLAAGHTLSPLGYAAYLGMTLAARLLGDRSVLRWGRVNVVRAGALLGVVGLALVVTGVGAWMVIGGFALAGALGVLPPMAFSAAGDVAPGSTDIVVGRLNYFNYVGVVLGAGVVGVVGTVLDLRTGFIVPALFLLVVPLVAGVLAVPGVGAGGRRSVAPSSSTPR